MKNQLPLITALCILSFVSCKKKIDLSHDTMEKVVQTEAIKPGFIHAVYFWIKDDADPTLKKEFIIGLDELAKVESIQSVYYGPPADTDRAVVDNSYDYAWITNFASSADHETYQIDPLHLAFIEKYNSLWKEVKVYDNLVRN